MNNIQNNSKKKLSTLIMLTAWSVWKERNGRVFEKKFRTIQQIVGEIKAEAKRWALASAGHFLLAEV